MLFRAYVASLRRSDDIEDEQRMASIPRPQPRRVENPCTPSSTLTRSSGFPDIPIRPRLSDPSTLRDRFNEDFTHLNLLTLCTTRENIDLRNGEFSQTEGPAPVTTPT
ncbi:hypothetical protein JAAARDRAFT_40010, partial [Jaapia argillacea MUCL 33604]